MNAEMVNDSSGVFKEYAYYYNLLYREKDYANEAKYIKGLIDKYSPCKRVEHLLNLGCGSGNHDFELSKLGFKITGVDASKSMIECALNKQKSDPLFLENIRFKLADICSFSFSNMELTNTSFDSVISLFHVSNYFTSNSQLLTFFRQAYRALKEGGIFIFDSWYGPAVLNQQPEARIKRVEDNNNVIWRMTTPELKVNENVVDVNYTLIIKDKLSKQINELKELHKMRYLFLPEIENYLDEVGFKLLSAHEFSTERDLNINTWNSCFVCIKE
ncbi:MAG: class I SAM-dependent methyltransferase [Oligoflexia bacterium]|nr:class I SAM-dependent methyltransferase [Oligoflexia bacterium]